MRIGDWSADVCSSDLLAGAAIGMALLAFLAGRPGSLILFTLAGMILSSLTGSLVALMISLVPTPFAASEIITWLMGALTDRSWDDVRLALPLMWLGVAVIRKSKSLNSRHSVTYRMPN